MSVEDVKSLVQSERRTEQTLNEAKEKATIIIEDARTKAKKILQEAEAGSYYEIILDKEMKKIEKKKRETEKEFDHALEELEEKARKNMEAAVSFIVKLVLGE